MKRTVILVLAAVLLIAGLAACDQAIPESYTLTHSAADADYIISWDEITDQCPDLEDYEKMEVFVVRGETAESPIGSEGFSLDDDSPVAWGNMRIVRTEEEGDGFRSFGVLIFFCDTDDYLDELIEEMKLDISFEEDGDFMTAILENELTEQSNHLLLAGKHFLVVIMDIASDEGPFFCSKDAFEELLLTIKSHISSLEITPLPADIPERIGAEDTSHQ